jgi:hypothetical protein
MNAYISEDSDLFVTIVCDGGSNSRRARASAVSALCRRLESERGIRLARIHTSRDEVYGFLSRTKIRYRVTATMGVTGP